MGVTPTKRSPAKNGRSPGRRSRSKALKATVSPAKDVVHSHVLPDPEQRKANGRVSGRDLIAWTRPRMMEKLILHMHYECARHKLNMPWNAIAHRLHPGSSGAALLQHLNRVRRDLLTEGHMVPPLAQKPSLAAQFREPNLRGYIRKFPHGNDTTTTRPVYFDEKIEDLKQSLPYGEEALDGQTDDECELKEDQAAQQSSPVTPSLSQSVPVVTPTRAGRSGSLATSHSEGLLHGDRGYHATGHLAANSFDSSFGVGRPCFPLAENGQPIGYTNGLQPMARSFDGGYFGSQEVSMRPEMRPEQNWTGWQDNRGCYVAMHSTHGMTPGQDLQQLYSPANGFYMGNYGHPISHSYGHHAPVTHMPGAYTIAQEQHAVRSTPSSPQKTPKVESPGPEMLNNVHYEAMDKTAFPTSIDNTGIPSTC